MKENITFDFNKIPEETMFNTRLMVKLTATMNPNKSTKPLNITAVLDRSGSMSGEPLHYVKMATKILANQLNPEDRFSLTMYDSLVNTIIPPAPIKDIRSIDSKIDSIEAGGMTFLSGGYKKGCSDALNGVSKDSITRVILLTDGHANEGITQPNQLAQLAANQRKAGVITTTIGVGEGYDEHLLGQMAENGGGSTYYIENPDDAPSVFKEELGYLKSMSASQVSVTFRPLNPQLNYKQLNSFKMEVDGTFTLGDFYSGQSKALIMELEIPPMLSGKNQHVGDLVISYKDTISDTINDESLTIPVHIDVVIDSEFKNETPDKDVLLESAFLLIAKAKSNSIAFADRGEYDNAANELEHYADLIARFNLNNEFIKHEINELRQRAEKLRRDRDEFYSIKEKKRMFYESEKMSKSDILSYDRMFDRRKD